MVGQHRKDAIGVRPERAHIAEAVDRIHRTPARVVKRGRQRQVIVVDAAEDGDPAHAHASRCWLDAFAHNAPY